jgi:hypothetical protein
VYTGGLLMGEVYEALAAASPVVISPVVTGTAYTISVFSRNLNHNPEDEWASSTTQVGAHQECPPGLAATCVFSSTNYYSLNAQVCIKSGLEVWGPPAMVMELEAMPQARQVALSWKDTSRPNEVLAFRVEKALYSLGGERGEYEIQETDLSAELGSKLQIFAGVGVPLGAGGYGLTVSGLLTNRRYSFRVWARNVNILAYIHAATGERERERKGGRYPTF